MAVIFSPGGNSRAGMYMLLVGKMGRGHKRPAVLAAQAALLFLDQIKREKGVWWMPWQQEAMKDVIPCVKPWGAGNRL